MVSEPSLQFRVSRRALWALGTLLLAPWILFGVWLLVNARRAAPPAPPPPIAAGAPAAGRGAASDLMRCAPGPWGRVEYYPTHIEPPDEFILTDYTVVDPRPWVFPGYTDGRLAALWQAAGLDQATMDALADPARRDRTKDAIVIRPPREVLIGLRPETRATIYAALAEFAENLGQQNPYRMRADVAAAWLADSGLPEDAVALTHRLLYRRGVAMCLSDEDLVLPLLTTSAQRAKYIKTLSRKTGLVVQLVIEPGTDVEPLVHYWGRGRRSKDLRPLLQSVARRPNGGVLDLLHLLPPFARTLVFTYPLPSNSETDPSRDCHWTSFNFFNESADDRFLDLAHVRTTLLSDYYIVTGPPAFGDIVMVVRAGTAEGVHSCVYLADNLVFTKNGPAFSVPWLVTNLDTVLAFYSSTPVEIRRYRLKDR